MNYYIRMLPASPGGPHKPTALIWKIDHDSAVRVGIANAQNVPGCFFKAQPGESIWDALRRQTPWFEPDGQNPFHQASLEPGQYYQRMARPIDQHPTEAPGWSPGAQKEANVVAIAYGQLIALTRQLERICQTAHPTKKTFDTFGHDIRNILILACTEAESHWRGVLVANGVNNSRFSTEDYVSLRQAMRLDEYAVTFPSYPWLEPIKPFDGWNKEAPTQTLKWYAAYNAVKHNREDDFERATLAHAFEAVTACAIMMAAQFGFHLDARWRSEMQSFYHFAAVPVWPLSDVYIIPYDAGDWTAVPFGF